ncbi:uncharacterized protein V6R79_006551 [Siganus canaliculatus]
MNEEDFSRNVARFYQQKSKTEVEAYCNPECAEEVDCGATVVRTRQRASDITPDRFAFLIVFHIQRLLLDELEYQGLDVTFGDI